MTAVVDRLTDSVLGLSDLFYNASTTVSRMHISPAQNDALEQFAMGGQQPLIKLIRLDLSFISARWPLLSLMRGKAAVCCKNLVAAYKVYLQSHGQLLTAVTEALKQLAASPWPEPAPPSTPDLLCTVEALFVNLWNMVVNISAFFDENMEVFHRSLLREVAAIQPVLHTLMKWLVRFLRYDTLALQMVKQRGLNHLPWQHAAICLVLPAMWPIRAITELPADEQLLVLSKLPTGFVKSLCSLACDLLGGDILKFIPPDAAHTMTGTFNPRHSSFVCNLPSALNHLLSMCKFNPQQEFSCRAELSGPAAVEVVKLAMKVACTSPHPAAQSVASSALSCLCMMFITADTAHRISCPPSQSCLSSNALSSSPPFENSSSQGESSFPCTCIPDCVFLSLLWKYAQTQPQALQQVFTILQLTLRVWSWKGILLPESQTGSCLPGLLHQSNKRVLHWIKKQRNHSFQEQPSASEQGGRDAMEMELLGCLHIAIELCVLAQNEQGLSTNCPSHQQASHGSGSRSGSPQPRELARLLGQQKQQTGSSNLSWRKMLAWQCKPARITVWEAVMRAASCPRTERTMQRVVEMSTRLIQLQLSTSSLDTLAASVGLVTTLRKTLITHNHIAAETEQFSLRGQQACMPSDIPWDLFSLLLDVLFELGVGYMAHGVTEPGTSSRGASERSPQNMRDLRQLAAVLVMGYIQLQNLQLREIHKHSAWHRADPHVSNPNWLMEISVRDFDLAQIAAHLSLPHPAAKHKQWLAEDVHSKLQGRVWERYALSHFSGRLLPGCCHLECRNLAGVSEAALVTQLCSGCMRVRYCSVACQRAAWVNGGHGAVCGKGGWAVQVHGV